jgi:hypothetical protein
MPEPDRYKGVCWKYALACMLEIKPSKVPHFVTPKRDNWPEDTRRWLEKYHKKGLVYVTANQFLETCEPYFNPSGGPDGYSIIVLSSRIEEEENHAAIALDGKLFFDPCETDCNDLGYVIGYFVLYDLPTL